MRRRSVKFSAPELRVLEQLAMGKTYRQVADSLHLAPATVAFHASRLQELLGVTNNVALVAIAIVFGLLTNNEWPLQLTGLAEIDVFGGPIE